MKKIIFIISIFFPIFHQTSCAQKRVRVKNKTTVQCHKCDLILLSHCLVKHMEIHKRNREGYACDKCDIVCSTPGNLNAHKLRHKRKKTHQCDQCDKSFYGSNELTRHLVVHSGEKKYVCEYCYAGFSQSGGLNRHVKKAHPEDYEAFEIKKKQKKALTPAQQEEIKVKQEQAGFECSDCQNIFDTADELNKSNNHKASCKRSIENNAQALNQPHGYCPKCDISFDLNNLRDHSHAFDEMT